MRVLVTGATGFLGGQIVLRLLETGHTVRVLARPSSDTSSLPPGVEIAYGDVTAVDSLLAACEGCDAAIHTAALVQSWWPDRKAFERVNVGGLQNMLHALRSVPSLSRLLYTSSFFALGPTDGFVGDSTTVHPGRDFCTEYERTKFLADRIAVRAAEEEGLNVVILYPGVIYGPGKLTAGNSIVNLIVDHFQGKLPGFVGPGTKKFSYVHVNDVVAGHLQALEQARAGQRILLTGENASMVDLFRTVQSVTGKPPPSLHLPFWLVRFLGLLSVLLAKCGGPIPLFTHESVRGLQHDWCYKIGPSEERIGYQPMGLRQGLEETLTWLRAAGVINF